MEGELQGRLGETPVKESNDPKYQSGQPEANNAFGALQWRESPHLRTIQRAYHSVEAGFLGAKHQT